MQRYRPERHEKDTQRIKKIKKNISFYLRLIKNAYLCPHIEQNNDRTMHNAFDISSTTSGAREVVFDFLFHTHLTYFNTENLAVPNTLLTHTHTHIRYRRNFSLKCFRLRAREACRNLIRQRTPESSFVSFFVCFHSLFPTLYIHSL